MPKVTKREQPTNKIFKLKNKKGASGYSLIEIAIVLTIIGIIGGYGLPLFTGMYQSAKNQVTRQHQEQIIHALGNYTLINGRLPTPCGFDTSVDELGKETTWNSHDILIGFIPHQALGISLDLTKDGFGNHMVYVVATSMTQTNGILKEGKSIEGELEARDRKIILGDEDDDETFFCRIDSPILLKNERERDVYKSPHTVPFLLIGFAQRSLGPLPKEGLKSSIQSDLEQKNLTSSHIFYTRPISPKGEVVFRQIVAHVSRNHLMDFYAQYPCTPNAFFK